MPLASEKGEATAVSIHMNGLTEADLAVTAGDGFVVNINVAALLCACSAHKHHTTCTMRNAQAIYIGVYLHIRRSVCCTPSPSSS